MIKLYLKIALRYLQKNKLYSFINIFGLAVGIASFFLIMIYVNYERSYDKFAGSENVFHVYAESPEGEAFIPSDAQTPNLSGPTLKKAFPEVVDQVRFYQLNQVSFIINENIIPETNGYLADASCINIFQHEMVEGDASTALTAPNSLVLTESTATKLFGDQAAMGKSVNMYSGSSNVMLQVTGIMKDIASNTHLKTNFLLSWNTMKTWERMEDDFEPNWNQYNFFTYIQVDKNADRKQLRKKITAGQFEGGDEMVSVDERHNIQPIEDIHLHSNMPYEAEVNGSITRVKFLSAIAGIILILSWLNYINLSTTKSLERAKEVGIRKVAGAQKEQLIVQSLLESIILNVIAILFAIGITAILLPFYIEFTGKALSFGLSDLGNLIPILLFLLVATVVVGLYPAMLHSSYTPIRALKGKIQASGAGLNIRKALIIVQFAATIILLVGTMVVTKQIDHLQKQPTGAELNQVVAFIGDIISDKPDSVLANEFNVLQQEIEKLPFVENMAVTQTYPGDGYNLSSFDGLTFPNGEVDETTTIYNYRASPSYFETVAIEFVAGQNYFTPTGDQEFPIAINETLARTIGFPDPADAVSQVLKFWGETWRISGVIKDYHHFGLKKKVEPLIIWPANSRNLNNVIVKLDPSANSTSAFRGMIDQLESTWYEIYPQSTFDFTLLDKKYEAQYKEDKKFGDAFRIFTILAILIAALGLFGLTSYTCIQRKKEIGVRKVNGASILSILKLLNLDFIKWIGIAFITAAPIAWYIMNSWLETFAVKTALPWWIFALAAVIAVIITMVTVSWQSFVAASANPVEALKDE